MVQLSAKEPSRIVLKCTQGNGDAIYVMGGVKKSTKIKDIDIRVTLLMINTMVTGCWNKMKSPILDNLKKEYMKDKALLDIKMGKLFQGYLRMERELVENI